MKHFLLILWVALGVTMATHAQTPSVKDLVESQNYVFQAWDAMPLSGHTRHLTTDYDVKVSKESVVSFLPYFGTAYIAPSDPTRSELDFTSKDFTYTTTERKKDGWTVTIKPKDYKDIQQMTIDISSKGYATLSVISSNTSAISFNGIITGSAQKGGQADRGSR